MVWNKTKWDLVTLRKSAMMHMCNLSITTTFGFLWIDSLRHSDVHVRQLTRATRSSRDFCYFQTGPLSIEILIYCWWNICGQWKFSGYFDVSIHQWFYRQLKLGIDINFNMVLSMQGFKYICIQLYHKHALAAVVISKRGVRFGNAKWMSMHLMLLNSTGFLGVECSTKTSSFVLRWCPVPRAHSHRHPEGSVVVK